MDDNSCKSSGLSQQEREAAFLGKKMKTYKILICSEEGKISEAESASKASEKDGIRALREASRHKYLKKRAEQKLKELRDHIEDEQYLVENVKLTEAEILDLRHKKEIYELVKKWPEGGL